MKIALIVPNNLWVSPYLSIYTRLFDELGVEYDTISWNREGRKETGLQFQYRERSRNQIAVLWAYMRYAKYLKKMIKGNGYDKLVVFTPQVGIFLSSFLERHFKGRYIFDYRDLSLEQNPIFKRPFSRVLANSYANIISSPGFKQYLPIGFDYIVSHNFNVEIVKNALIEEAKPYEGGEISVLTIGALRTDMNIEVMDALGNLPGYYLAFVGKGISADYLENYSKSKGYDNVSFSGYYKKEDEPEIIKRHTFINIVYPLIPSHISALSNRFYNSLIYKRPMIVSRTTTQGNYALQYGVGLVVDNCDNLKEQIEEYRKMFDFEKYSNHCNQLLNVFLNENLRFEEILNSFVIC